MMKRLRGFGDTLFAVFCWGTLAGVVLFLIAMGVGMSQQVRD